MDITFIALTIFLFVAILFLIIFLFKNINKKSFVAEDGSVFDNQNDLDLYTSLYEKTRPLFSVIEDNTSGQVLLGFEKLFLSKLITDGFIDLKSLVKYRKQFKLLSDLINT